MNRCPALHDPANHLTRCFRDPGHDGAHLWFGDPTAPPVEWFSPPVVVSIVDRIRQGLGL